MQAAIWGWDTTNKKWVKALVDSLGHLQADILTSVLPTGAATETTLDLVRAELDGIEGLLAGGLPSALDTDSLKIREQGTPTVRITGYDGSNWQSLLVESDVLKNLRVKLYDGASGVEAATLDNAYVPSTKVGLLTKSMIFSRDGTPLDAIGGTLDNRAPSATAKYLTVSAWLYGFDGSNWDRIRTYGIGIQKVGRAEVGLSTSRLEAVGQVKASAGTLFWMAINPSAANAVVELTNATAGSGTVVFDTFHTSRETHLYTFDPPMEFSTGIYLETFTNLTSVVFGYR